MTSTITISEILTGAYLTSNKKHQLKRRSVLNQFEWCSFGNETAEVTGKFLAYLITNENEKQVEYQDVVIAATAKTIKADILLTLNKRDFESLPKLEDKIYRPKEIRSDL